MAYVVTEDKKLLRIDLDKLHKSIESGQQLQASGASVKVVCEDARLICLDGKALTVLSHSSLLFDLNRLDLKLNLD